MATNARLQLVRRARRWLLLPVAAALALGGGVFVEPALPAHAGGSGGASGLVSVSAPSTTHAWAVGNTQSTHVAEILATTDGVTWTSQTVPGTKPTLLGVSFPAGDVTHGWATGSELIHTTDGSTWTVVSGTPAGFEGSGVAARSSTHAVTVGATCPSGPCTPAILYTTDGSTWNTATVTTTGLTSIDSVAFGDDSHVFAVASASAGGSVGLVSTDGGATWAHTAGTIPNTFTASAITAVSATQAWVAGYGTAADVYATTDGGATWVAQTTAGNSNQLTGIAFADALHGWAVGSSGSASILTTVNGGTNWTPQTVPAGAFPRAVSAASTSVVYAVGVGTCTRDSILKTSDDGSTWQEFLDQTPWLEYLDSVSFAKGTTSGYAVGSNSCGAPAILATTNGGSSWAPQTVPSGVTALSAVAAGDATHAWAVGQGASAPAIIGTANGTSWAAQTVPSGTVSLNGVAATSATNAVAVGQQVTGLAFNMAVLHTTDGSTWTAATAPTTSGSLSAVSFGAAMDAWATGYAGTTTTPAILASTDGGSTWLAQVPSTAVNNLVGAAAGSANNAWAVGNDANAGGAGIQGTANTGTTWAQQAVPTGKGDLLGAVATTASNAWAVGASPGSSCLSGFGTATILTTGNGGTTWTAQNPPANVDCLEGISATSSTALWAVGQDNADHAVILATSNGGTAWAAQPFTYPAPTLTSLALAVPTSATASQPFNVGVTAKNSDGSTATGYRGTVHFISSDAQATLPGDYTFTSTDNGMHLFTGVILRTTGSQSITAYDLAKPSVNGSSSLPVSAGPATHLGLSANSSTNAGAAFSVTVTAVTASNTTDSGYRGTVHFTSNDTAATVPGDYTFTSTDSGTHVFAGVILRTPGTKSVTATDTVTASITGSASLIVGATHLSVSAPPTAATGQPFNVTVTAQGASNGTATAYADTIHFTSTDPSAALPANYTYVNADNGAHTFSVTLNTANQETVTATDTQSPAITGTSGTISVAAPPATGGDGPPAPAFQPHGVGAPSAVVLPDGSQQLVFWRDAIGHVVEAWYAGGNWNGPLDLTSAFFGGASPLVSAPSAAVTPDGSTQQLFWQGAGGHLVEAWYAGGAWHGPVDISGAALGGAIMNSAPSVANTPDGHQQMVFWRGAANHLFESWFAGGSWHGPADITSAAFGGAAPLSSAPTATVSHDGSTQLVFWQGAAGQLEEGWYAGGAWHGPLNLTGAVFGGAAPLASSPSVVITADGSQQLVYWRSAVGHLEEAWFAGGSWHGPLDLTATAFGGGGPLTSAPSAVVTPDGSSQLVFWQGFGSTLWEAWYTGSWNGPVNFTS